MPYIPLGNEIAIQPTQTVGPWPGTMPAFARYSITELRPNIDASVSVQLLDINGSPILGASFASPAPIDISTNTQLPPILNPFFLAFLQQNGITPITG